MKQLIDDKCISFTNLGIVQLMSESINEARFLLASLYWRWWKSWHLQPRNTYDDKMIAMVISEAISRSAMIAGGYSVVL